MPVDMNSDRWMSEEPMISVRTAIVEFLESSPNQAFTAEEACEHVFETGFEIEVDVDELPLYDLVDEIANASSQSAFLESLLHIEMGCNHILQA